MPEPADDLKARADWIAAIGEPTRLNIISILATGEKTVTELAKVCRVEMVNISHHLGVMKSAGLVDVTRDGRFMLYNLIGARASGGALELSHESGITITIPFH